MRRNKLNAADKICAYDEGYDIYDAEEIGWCHNCKCDPDCPMKKKIQNEASAGRKRRN